MMSVDARSQQILKAKKELELATAQETETGNPVVGAKHYFTAIELVMAAVQDMKHDSPESRDYFLYQVRQKLEDYFARARLLLSVAEEEGLDLDLEDCMPFSGGSRPPQRAQPVTGMPCGPAAPLGSAPPATPQPLGHVPSTMLPPPQANRPSHDETAVGCIFAAIQPLGFPRLPNSGNVPHTGAPGPPPPFPPPLPPVAATHVHQDPGAADDSEGRPPTLGEIPVECFLFGVAAPNKTTASGAAAPCSPGPAAADAGAASSLPSLTAAARAAPPPAESSGGSRSEEASQPQGSAPSSSSSARRMFAEDDSLRPGNPSFEELFRNFTNNCADEITTAADGGDNTKS